MELRDCHSVLHDAELLDHAQSFNDILLHLNEKLPITIWKIFNLARECSLCKKSRI